MNVPAVPPFNNHSRIAIGANFCPSLLPNLDTKSAKLPTVTGTNAGPLTAVPITPAGIPVIVAATGPDRSISLVWTPGLNSVKFAI